MRVAIIGSRDYVYLNRVRAFVNSLPEGTEVVSGGAWRVDQTAENCARARGLKVHSIPVDKIGLPEYGTEESRIEYGRRAYARNQKIVDFADFVVAFWDGYSGGTRDTIEKARTQEKLFEVFK